jgi:hypothetical protein
MPLRINLVFQASRFPFGASRLRRKGRTPGRFMADVPHSRSNAIEHQQGFIAGPRKYSSLDLWFQSRKRTHKKAGADSRLRTMQRDVAEDFKPKPPKTETRRKRCEARREV